MKRTSSRRHFIAALLAAPFIFSPRGLSPAQGRREATQLLDVRQQKQFVNRLPRPSRATPDPGTRHYEIEVRQFRGSVGLTDPRTGRPARDDALGLRGPVSRPDVRRPPRRGGHRAMDQRTHRGRATAAAPAPGGPLDPHRRRLPRARRPACRSSTHLHGGHVEASSDGHPEAWFTPSFTERGPAFAKEIYEYPNDQEAATLWYHDHALGLARLNVERRPCGLLPDSRRRRRPPRPTRRHRTRFRWSSRTARSRRTARSTSARAQRRRRAAPEHPARTVRRRDPGQRHAVAVRAGRAASLPAASAERIRLPLLRALLPARPFPSS